MSLARASHVIVQAPAHLGDCVAAAQAVAQLHRLLPDTHLHIVAKPRLLCLFEGLPGVASVRLGGLDSPGAAALPARQMDAALLLAPSLRAALAAWRARVPIRVGVRWDGRGPLLTHPMPVRGRLPFDAPQLTVYLRLVDLLVEALGLEPAQLPPPRMPEVRRARAEPLVIINPHARHPTRRWPAARFVEVGVALAERGVRVQIIGGPGEGALTASIAAQVPGAAARLGSNPEDVEALSALLGCADLLISSDSGPVHLAAWSGTPVVCIFGATDPAMTGLGLVSGHHLLTAAPPCQPCYSAGCDVGLVCLQQVSVAAVVGAALDALGGTS